MRKIEKKRPRRGRFYFTLLFCRHQLTTNSNFDDSKPKFFVFPTIPPPARAGFTVFCATKPLFSTTLYPN